VPSNQAIRASRVARRPGPPRARAALPISVTNIVPRSLRTTLHYYDYYNLATGAASYAVYNFRANSCRDPYAGVGGGSPSGFTQLGYLYQHIHVDAVKVHVWGYNTCQSPIIIGLMYRSSHGTALASGAECQQVLMEMPDIARCQTLIPYGSGTSYPTFDIQWKRSVSQIEGRPVSDEDYGSSFGVEPNVQCYADLIIVAADGSTTTLTANCHVKISYTVTVSEPNQTYTD